jgi:arginyl-tRNA synthetase
MDGLYDFAGLAASLARALTTVIAPLAAAIGRSEDEVAAHMLPELELTVPPRREQGDVTTNVALVVAGRYGLRPRDLADELGRAWQSGEGADVCERYEVAGPGFLNVFLRDTWYVAAVQAMLAAGGAYGAGVLAAEQRTRVNVEFVSVNPTGPLHVGHARYAAYGDALCRILAFAGYDVTREFYINDYGTQMTRFGQSLAARYAQRLGVDFALPVDGYQGEYVLDFADRLIVEVGDRYRAAVIAAAPDAERLPLAVVDEIKIWGRDRVLEVFRATLARLRVSFDAWTSEATLYAEADGSGTGNGTDGHRHRGFAGEVGKVLAEMDAEGLLYEDDGAVWLRTTAYGDDKDRVLIRQTGEPTYFLSDIAYHRDKLDRGFAHLINIWGADHHGYVRRMKAAFTALPPHDPDKLELVIGQLVNLTESGLAKRMSKRKGDIVTIDDLMDAIGVDATRFFLVGRSHDSMLDLDLDLAVEASNKNPVYYVQYAHARIASILRSAGAAASAAGTALPPVAVEPAERALVRALAQLPLVVREAAVRRAPHRINHYLGELAAEFHVFYRECKVLTDDADVAAFRIGLCRATGASLATGLQLLGVTAPERM